MLRKLFVVAFSVFNSMSSWGQAEAESKTIKILEHTPTAPNTSSLSRYFDVPVNMATGVPNIQIPLYTIKTGNITLPISLTYHGSGIKVNTAASWVGLGWDLNCGGVITKQVNGLDDFKAMTQYSWPPGGSPDIPHSDYFNPDYTYGGQNLGFTSMTNVVEAFQSAPTNYEDLLRLTGRIIQNKYDGESDEYHYSTPQGSGTIFYNQNTASFQTNQLDGATVSYIGGTNEGWYVGGKNGIGYSFLAREESRSPFYEGTTYNSNNYFTSAWYLSSIGDAINNKGISFEYNTSGVINFGTSVSTVEDWTVNGSPHTYAGGATSIRSSAGTQVNISVITFNEGRIEFIKDVVARVDGGVNALKTIKIFDKNNALKKRFELTYTYGWSGAQNTTRLLLSTVQEINYINGAVNESNPYVISYKTNIAMPPRFSFAQDIWGYNNGKTANTTNIPTDLILNQQYGYPTFADRFVDQNFTQAGVIEKITYPTGGSLNFTFENNKDINNKLVGGLRIKSIVNADITTGKNLTTEYRYNDDNGISTGYVPHPPLFYYFLDKGMLGLAYCRFSGEPILPLFSNQGSPISYDRVEKIEIGENMELKSRHYFHNNLEGIPVQPVATYQNLIGVPFNKYSNLKQFTNLPYKTEVFKKDGSVYKKIKQDVQGYNTLNQFQKYIWNVQAAWAKEMGAFTEWDGWDPYSAPVILSPIVSINAYKLFQESVVNDLSESSSYDDNGNEFKQTVEKKFDQTNGNLTEVKTVSSNGDIHRNYFSYASDLSHTTSSNPINQQVNILLDNGILAAPIEIIKTVERPGLAELITEADLFIYENNKLKKNLKINQDITYSTFVKASNDNNGFYYDSRYEPESEVELLDADKNAIQIKLKSKVQSVIWDGENIIATAVNANVSDIAATSFETSVKGRWTYSGATSNDNNSPSGTKVYSLNGAPVTNSSLASNKTYVVSYWSLNGPQNVNGSAYITGRVLNNWTYYEHKVVNPSSGTITVSGSGTIDGLRLYPENALMITYTYNPLIGMTSQCDANNRMTYYEYDGFGRLSLIRDQDKNILKKICYNYTGQPETCSANCVTTAPNWQNTLTAPTCVQVNGVNTGYQLQEQKDMNPCSNSFNSLQTVSVYNPSACPPPSSCNTGNCNGDNKKCVNGVCETGVLKIISTRRVRMFGEVDENGMIPMWWQYYCTSAYCFSDGTNVGAYEYPTSGFCTTQICN